MVRFCFPVYILPPPSHCKSALQSVFLGMVAWWRAVDESMVL